MGLGLGTVGLVFMLSRLWNALCGSLDRASVPITPRPAFGRRKPWIAAGAAVFIPAVAAIYWAAAAPDGAASGRGAVRALSRLDDDRHPASPPWASEACRRLSRTQPGADLPANRRRAGARADLASARAGRPVRGARRVREDRGDGRLRHRDLYPRRSYPAALLSRDAAAARGQPGVGARRAPPVRDQSAGAQGHGFGLLRGDGAGASAARSSFFYVSAYMGLPKWASLLFLLQFVFGVFAGPLWLRIGYRFGKHQTVVPGRDRADRDQSSASCSSRRAISGRCSR